jgi:thiamine-monophosphate kinase
MTICKTFKNISEFKFIERIRPGCLVQPDRVVKAIGDDAAAFTVKPDRVMLLTTDLLIERVHFITQATSGFDLGYKALAVNLSDIAAMGGTALDAFVSIGIPATMAMDFIEEFYRGLKSLAAEFNVNILGGDTTGSKTDLVVNIAVTGEVTANKMLGRDQAQAGDIIFSSGFLGDSRAGLHLLCNPEETECDTWTQLKHAHLKPRPHLREGQFLASYPAVHAAIDVSDGLSSDLAHILKVSAKGARLTATAIPVSEQLERFCRHFDFEPTAYALAGGEDYVLVCTVAPKQADTIAQAFEHQFGRPLFKIGTVTPSGPLEIVEANGTAKPLKPDGWDHFKREMQT